MATAAKKIVRAPSMKKSHLHAACPSFPCMPSRIPDATNAPNALLAILPQVKMAVRRPSSSRLYHLDSKNCEKHNNIKHSTKGLLDALSPYQCAGEEGGFHESKKEPRQQSSDIPEK